MKRQSIYLEEFGHKNPIPSACRMGDWVATGIIYGLDPETGKPAETLERQCELMFRHLRSVLAASGCGPEHILKLNVLLTDRSQRGPLNREWEAMFPDPADRPARQTMQAELDGGKLIQCDCIAVVRASPT
jgi:2-iminobutanoate/2-iminopropanoate deaminase